MLCYSDIIPTKPISPRFFLPKPPISPRFYKAVSRVSPRFQEDPALVNKLDAEEECAREGRAVHVAGVAVGSGVEICLE